MKRVRPIVMTTTAIALFFAVAALSSQMSKPHPLTMPLECSKGDCPLLQGAPLTTGMRSGFVRLKPGETVGWHTTGQNEEALVILRGQGEALIEGHQKLALAAPMLAYIPPASRHNVADTSKEALEYVYVVAPATAGQQLWVFAPSLCRASACLLSSQLLGPLFCPWILITKIEWPQTERIGKSDVSRRVYAPKWSVDSVSWDVACNMGTAAGALTT